MHDAFQYFERWEQYSIASRRRARAGRARGLYHAAARTGRKIDLQGHPNRSHRCARRSSRCSPAIRSASISAACSNSACRCPNLIPEFKKLDIPVLGVCGDQRSLSGSTGGAARHGAFPGGAADPGRRAFPELGKAGGIQRGHPRFFCNRCHEPGASPVSQQQLGRMFDGSRGAEPVKARFRAARSRPCRGTICAAGSRRSSSTANWRGSRPKSIRTKSSAR